MLGTFLYVLYTADLTENELTHILIFADYTAVLSGHNDPVQASVNLLQSLDEILNWFRA